MSMASDMKELALKNRVSLRPKIMEEIQLAASQGQIQIITTNIQSILGDVDWIRSLGFHADCIGFGEWIISWA